MIAIPIKETIPQSFARSSQMTAPFTQGGLYADDGSFYAFTGFARNVGLCPHMKNPRGIPLAAIKSRKRPCVKAGTHMLQLAAETANLAENLPDGVTTGVAIVVTREEKHLADLLFRICLAKTSAL